MEDYNQRAEKLGKDLEAISKDVLNADDPNEVQIVFEDEYDILIQAGMIILAFDDYKKRAIENVGFEDYFQGLRNASEEYSETRKRFMIKVNKIVELLHED